MVSGDSMLPTLKPGDLLLIERHAYDQAEPDRGDIVVARQPGCLIVKRVVGLPGEEVEVKQGSIYVNGECVDEKHQINEGLLTVGEGKLLPGDFATLGDNRAVSPLTAVHPIVTKDEILGKVVLIVHAKLL